jgi:hypothetical protein
MHQRQVVDSGLHERAQHQRDDVAGARRVGAGRAGRAYAIGEHAALCIERKLAGRGEIAAMGAAQEFVAAIAAPADLLVQLGRGVGHDTVFRIEAGLLAKTAADIADQHAHAVRRTLQDRAGQEVAGRARRLRLRVQKQPPRSFFDFSDGRARLHGRRRQALADDLEQHRVLSLGEHFLHLGSVAIAHRGHDIVGRLRPYHGRAGFRGFHGIDHRRQHFIIDGDGLRRRLRLQPRLRNHGRNRLAHEAHDFMRQEASRRHRHRRAVRALENIQRGQRADIVLDEIGAGIDRGNAGHLRRIGGVDRKNLRMRMRRAQHMEPERAVLRLVVDERSLPREQPLVFQTLDGLARAKTQIAGKNVHSIVLQVFLLVIGGVLADFGHWTTCSVIPGSPLRSAPE